MYICIDCGFIFEEPKYYESKENPNSALFSRWDGCPRCAGAYASLLKCSVCGENIIDDYIELANHEYVCSECYAKRRLGDNE